MKPDEVYVNPEIKTGCLILVKPSVMLCMYIPRAYKSARGFF